MFPTLVISSGFTGLIAKSPQLVHLEVDLGYNGVLFPEIPTLHEVPEDHSLQLTHLVLNGTGICVDSSTLPHLRSLISLDSMNLPALIDGANLIIETGTGFLDFRFLRDFEAREYLFQTCRRQCRRSFLIISESVHTLVWTSAP